MDNIFQEALRSHCGKHNREAKGQQDYPDCVEVTDSENDNTDDTHGTPSSSDAQVQCCEEQCKVVDVTSDKPETHTPRPTPYPHLPAVSSEVPRIPKVIIPEEIENDALEIQR